MTMTADRARRLANEVLDQRRADSTLADYVRKTRSVAGDLRVDGLENARATLERLAEERNWSHKTIYGYKAAIQHGMAQRIRHALTERDRARDAGDKQAAAKARREIVAAGTGLEALHPDPHRQRHEDKTVQGLKGAKSDGKRRKRRSLVGKPATWRWDLIRELPKEDRLPILVMACTGCRPVEVEHGVALEMQGPQVVARIRGAKVREYQGQPERVLYLRGGELVDKLRAYLLKYGPQTVRRARNEKSRSAFRRTEAKVRSEKGWKGEPLSYYSFRQQFGSDLKAAGVDEEGIAAALGHRTDRVQRSYGDSRTGGGRGVQVQLAGAETTCAVKHVERAPLAPGQRPVETGSSSGNGPPTPLELRQ